MPTIDESYATLVRSLPIALHPIARQLPWRLGLTSSRQGGWGYFVGLHPNRELPVYAAQAQGRGGLCLSEGALARYVRAHHLGGFTWLLRDRLEDGQVATDDQLLELSAIFGVAWRDALADATGNVTLSELVCRRACARWRRGTEAESRVLARGSLRPPIYAAVVREKLGWISAPAQALLADSWDPRRVTAFLHAHDLFLLGLQLIDDVVDARQDRELRGGDVPSAIGCSPGALVRAAPKLLEGAAVAAADGGFSWFAAWLEQFAHATRSWRIAGDALGDELDAIGIAGEIEQAIVAETDPPARVHARPVADAAPA